jgi:pimeloyl-ACP methyl ester carboxylesterase
MGAGAVHIAPFWPPDWMLLGVVGFGPIMRRAGRAIARAYQAGGRQPIIVVGHSAGGIAARLAMAAAPYHGRRSGVAEAVGCLVTLGTPHRLRQIPNRYRHAGHDACEFLDRESPGAYFAPRTSYVTVGSSHPEIAVSGLPGRVIGDFFTIAVGEHTRHSGDGIVPASAVHLEGAEQLTYDDVRHGVFGGPWYGDEAIISRWWPVAVDRWRDALEARSRTVERHFSSAIAGRRRLARYGSR